MNNLVYYLSQSLFIMVISVDLTFTGLVGEHIAPSDLFATLPYALITLLTALSSLAVPFAIRRFRERAVFCLGATLAITSGVVAFYAINQRDFVLFCLAAALVGSYLSFAQYYRLSIADNTEGLSNKSKVISRLVLSGVVGAIVGPLLLRYMLDTTTLSGISHAYLFTSALGALTLLLFLVCFRNRAYTAVSGSKYSQNDTLVAHQFLTAVSSTAVGYAVMMFVMVATPLAMVDYGYAVGSSSVVIQVHVIAMFGSAFITQFCIKKFGEHIAIGFGIVLQAACCSGLIISQSLPVFIAGLLLLGMGWNLMFVAGTSLVSKSYPHVDRFKYQSIAEFVTFGLSACASLSAEVSMNALTWRDLNLLCMALLVIPLICVFGSGFKHSRAAHDRKAIG